MEFKQSHSGNYRAGRTGKIEYIVIHYTANDGDTAQGNLNYFASNTVQASAHYFVDESGVCQSVKDADTAWHCGANSYRHPYCRNANSIGIELCSRKKSDGTYYFLDQTVANAAALTKQKMAEYGIDSDHVVRHYDVTGKKCPAPMVDDEEQWEKFKSALTESEVEDMTEEQVRKIVTEMLRGTDSTVSKSLADEWASAQSAGITDGTRPGGYATREQVAAMVLRAAKS
jgi:N-acetylmuramoyl-L-alanine amidase CwlA